MTAQSTFYATARVSDRSVTETLVGAFWISSLTGNRSSEDAYSRLNSKATDYFFVEHVQTRPQRRKTMSQCSPVWTVYSSFRVTGAADDSVSSYVGAKRSNDVMGRSCSHLLGTPTTDLGYFRVNGRWDRRDMIVFLTTIGMSCGSTIKLHIHGAMLRPFGYLDNVDPPPQGIGAGTGHRAPVRQDRLRRRVYTRWETARWCPLGSGDGAGRGTGNERVGNALMRRSDVANTWAMR